MTSNEITQESVSKAQERKLHYERPRVAKLLNSFLKVMEIDFLNIFKKQLYELLFLFILFFFSSKRLIALLCSCIYLAAVIVSIVLPYGSPRF